MKMDWMRTASGTLYQQQPITATYLGVHGHRYCRSGSLLCCQYHAHLANQT